MDFVENESPKEELENICGFFIAGMSTNGYKVLK